MALPKNMKGELPPAQKTLLRLICEYIDDRGIQPTLRELASDLELNNCTVHVHLQHLIRKGYLRSDAIDGNHRILTILRRPTSESSLLAIPIVGSIPAGIPKWENAEFSGEVLVDASLFRNGSYFALRVDGSSMINAGINSGDVVILRQQQVANNGEIVAAMLNDGEMTLKRFVRNSEGIFLKPENDTMKPIPVKSSDRLAILGVLSQRNRIERRSLRA